MVEKSLESRRRHMTKCVHGQSDPVDCILLGSSVHRTFQGRILFSTAVTPGSPEHTNSAIG